MAGWVQRRRDHGGIAFLDIRDSSGLIQVVADPESHPEVAGIRMEFCVSVTGEVRARPEGTENPDLATGAVEVGVEELSVLSAADPLPFMIDDRTEVDERARLRYRYLDLRRPRMSANLRARSRATMAIRRTLDGMGFLEVETPTLVNSTPEGARDMLVPSRLQPGEFYALPQSPQLFKQLLMISGVERYFQIARCYRDEDFRADRQLEFTQLDLEGSFWGRDDVLAAIEEVLVAVVEESARPVRAPALLSGSPGRRRWIVSAVTSPTFASKPRSSTCQPLRGHRVRGVQVGPGRRRHGSRAERRCSRMVASPGRCCHRAGKGAGRQRPGVDGGRGRRVAALSGVQVHE